MAAHEVKAIEIVDDSEPLPMGELLDCIHIERTYLIEMVEAGVVSPRGTEIEHWIFVRRDLRRLRTAQRLMADLDINISGAALVLDLLDEREALLKLLDKTTILRDL